MQFKINLNKVKVNGDNTITVRKQATDPYEPENNNTGFLVSGAGSSAVDGVYCQDFTNNIGENGIHRGKKIYVKPGDRYYILWARDSEADLTWSIYDDGDSEVKYRNSADTELPPLTGWMLADGNSPAPTLSSTSCDIVP
jgi:hypothetical protein